MNEFPNWRHRVTRFITLLLSMIELKLKTTAKGSQVIRERTYSYNEKSFCQIFVALVIILRQPWILPFGIKPNKSVCTRDC